MRKLFKVGLAINGALLFAGYYNSGKKLEYEVDRLELNKKYGYEEFKKDLDDFNKLRPQYYIKKQKVSRGENLEKLKSEKFDILVIGGGCSGAGVLLEADQRGYRCALIESDDFASKTSSRSTKLIHGGIRYLQDAFKIGSGAHFEKLKLVFEALQERDFLINSLPYLNNIVEIKLPYKNLFQMDYYYVGLVMYQFLYAFNNFPSIINTFPWPRIYFSDKQVSLFEGQMFDSRQNILSIFSTKNSAYANYFKFIEYLYDSNKKIIGVKAVDTLTNKEFNIYSTCVVNCTGIYADSNFNKDDALKDKLITASKGIHLVVKKDLFKNLNSGYMLPETSDGRILFVLPYQNNYFIIGTTDDKKEKSDTISADQSEVDYLFSELSREMNISKEDISKNLKSQWAGLRPLVKNPDDPNATKSLARNHVIRIDKNSGLISLLGGKWTIYRKMGEDVIKEINKLNLLGDSNIHKNKQFPNSDLNLKLSGAIHHLNENNKNLSFVEEKFFYAGFESYLIKEYSIESKLASNLVFKYGLNSIKIMEIDKQYSKGSIKDRFLLEGDNPILTAELLYSINYEMAVKPNDFLCRRTGLAFVDYKEAEALLDRVVSIMAKEMKWNKDVIKLRKEEAKSNLKFLI